MREWACYMGSLPDAVYPGPGGWSTPVSMREAGPCARLPEWQMPFTTAISVSRAVVVGAMFRHMAPDRGQRAWCLGLSSWNPLLGVTAGPVADEVAHGVVPAGE